MNESVSGREKLGLRRLLPLSTRAKLSRWLTNRAGWLAEWICPEEAEWSDQKITTSLKAGASSPRTPQYDETEDEK